MEYWSARDLQKSLGYEKWDNFSKVIDKAMLACDVAGFDIKDHFPGIRKMVEMPSKPRKDREEIGFPDVGKTKKVIGFQRQIFGRTTAKDRIERQADKSCAVCERERTDNK